MTEHSQPDVARATDEGTFESGPPHGFCKHCGRSREVHVLVGAAFFCKRPGTEGKFTDAQRLDWLEKAALRPNGILLHDGSKITGRTGLGVWPPKRTLRDALDHCLRYPDDF